jgi:MFS family permease
MIGRFVLGFGTALCTSSQYMAEISPVHLRGRFVGIFGACYQIGAVLMGGAMVTFSRWDTSNWQWRAPLLLQSVGPLIVCSTIYFLCPEIPRYLVMKGRYDEDRAVIAKTMTTDNDISAPIVAIVFRQIEESLESATRGTKTLRSFWDFRVFFTRRVAFRTMIIVVYSCFQSWNGVRISRTCYLDPAPGLRGASLAFPLLDQLSHFFIPSLPHLSHTLCFLNFLITPLLSSLSCFHHSLVLTTRPKNAQFIVDLVLHSDYHLDSTNLPKTSKGPVQTLYPTGFKAAYQTLTISSLSGHGGRVMIVELENIFVRAPADH